MGNSSGNDEDGTKNTNENSDKNNNNNGHFHQKEHYEELTSLKSYRVNFFGKRWKIVKIVNHLQQNSSFGIALLVIKY